MPSSDLQCRLIMRTYNQCGLYPYRWTDQPQFFEAHGTGTSTGDHLEAEAIHLSFFRPPYSTMDENVPRSDKLYVGSIKTVIGHLEGCAGLAGLLKSSLTIKNATIPANMLFAELNPAIRPFYSNLEVPTRTISWPSLPQGVPRRVSINSFGFGGKFLRHRTFMVQHMLNVSRFKLSLHNRKS